MDKENTGTVATTGQSTSTAPSLRRSTAPLLLRALGAAGKARPKKTKKTKQTTVELSSRASTAGVTPTARASVAAPGSCVGAAAVRWEPGLHMVMARRKGVGFARSFSLKGGTPRKARKVGARAAAATATTQAHTNDNTASRRRRSSLRSSAQPSPAKEEAHDDGSDSDGQWF